MTAPDPVTKNLILPVETANQPAELARINSLLEAAGLGRPLREKAAGTGRLVRVPLVDGADPTVVRDAMLGLNRAGHGVPAAMRDVDYDAATHDVQPDADKDLPEEKLVLTGYGKKTGFAFIDWTDTPPMDPAPAWSGIGRQPVVALLDTEIRPHGWLKAADAELCWKLAGWDSPLHDTSRADSSESRILGSHYGHATFITGLLRQHVPGVQIFSFPVMEDDGKVKEAVVNDALTWLVEHHHELSVDLVLMAFGRPREDADERSPEFEALVTLLKALSERGVTTVAAAGNSHSSDKVVPAGLADRADLRVVSVGAGTKEQPDCFSNFGDWVKAWSPGTDLVSIMPIRKPDGSDGDGYARWSGTSFAAADYAAILAPHG